MIKKVKSKDDKDLGKIQAITNDYIQTKDGTISKNYYYIPKYYLEGYDGDHLWVSLTKDEVKSRFEAKQSSWQDLVRGLPYHQRIYLDGSFLYFYLMYWESGTTPSYILSFMDSY